MKIPFKAGNILIPKKNIDMTKWSVVACDQYTSEPEYWNEVKNIVGDSPSTLNLTLPEIYLEESDVEERIKRINVNMEEMLKKDIFDEYKDSMIYLERTQNDGKVREGLMGIVDLEAYSYEKGSQTLIRATEKTVIERIPPRMKVRENALLELPHIMILIDDEKKDIIESLKNKVSENDVVYDFELMQKGGHIKGYKLNNDVINEINTKLEALADKEYFEKKYDVKDKGILLFAMGDGNHSLATAKACYEKLKETMSEEEYLNNPARYALVELVNLHSGALEFEAIHRVIFDTDVNDLLDNLYKYYDINEEGNGQKFELVTKDMDKVLYISNPKSNIAVGSIQMFLDEYLSNHNGKIDYIHGEDVTKEFAKKDNNVGIIFDAMAKEDLFKTVILDGALPRKTFSMGHSYDKRFYLEARKIK
ncbi:MAG: DUF1015 domain-containing protein [Bacilli bacterium]|nr:DUF1015 domain-containing protein [Bacilli bacterium]